MALLALTVAAGAAVVAVLSLILTLDHPTRAPATPTTPTTTYTVAESSAAQQQLCNTYRLAARAVQTDTNGTDVGLGRVALTNAAAMLDSAAADPALDPAHRDAAHALATAYRTATAMGSKSVATDAEFHAALDDINVKDAVLKNMCNGS
ncbi:hypothetical protein H7K15_07010 [Mycobacterium parmense]|nr:hypothetical protein [Mycobacterium parmense]